LFFPYENLYDYRIEQCGQKIQEAVFEIGIRVKNEASASLFLIPYSLCYNSAMNETPASVRIHIGFFGRRNAGKSSLVNAVTGQNLAIVSEVKGTTTDPVYKAMELLPLGPVVIIDTPGIDDEGALGEQRVLRAKQVLNKADVAVLVIDAQTAPTAADTDLMRLFAEKEVPFIIAYNKSDLLEENSEGERPGKTQNSMPAMAETLLRGSPSLQPPRPSRSVGVPVASATPTPLPPQAEAVPLPSTAPAIFVSAKTGRNIEALKEQIAALAKTEETKLQIVADLLRPSDFVVLVVPIDKAAPKGRLILPQQQTIRDILEADAAAIVVKEYELRETLAVLGKKPRMVITDSQVFAKVSADTPRDVPLTSFSILFARYNGLLKAAVEGVAALDTLADGDAVLISEGCTHHRQCDDIGTVKLPRWIKNYTGKDITFAFTSGGDFPFDLKPYRLIVHCGGCMLTPREMRYRQKCAADQAVPITNYGILIAHIQGILERSVEMFNL
jgi:small GTP-binding protein